MGRCSGRRVGWRHRWGAWTEPLLGWDDYGWSFRHVVQRRRCELCGVVEANRIAAMGLVKTDDVEDPGAAENFGVPRPGNP